MAVTIYPFDGLGQFKNDWLHARYHFSFSEYHNPNRIGFGTLRVINDDIIQPQSGFGMHPHRDMEIITYVRKGAISHEDNLGNKGRTAAGDVQVMSAGKGILHAEQNAEDEETNLFQIWITPRESRVQPRWDMRKFPKTPVTDALHLLVSGRKEDEQQGALYIHQDAFLYGGRLEKGQEITHKLHHQAYLLVSEGEITLDGTDLKKGDGAEVTGQESVKISAVSDAEVVVIDVPA
ncbi:MAG: pirin family protein [Alphaproteobacteria bacterium]|nr:MAG: pirin family protein [Alphaproteobacteria bacterium]